MTYYKAHFFNIKIEPVEIDDETDFFIIINDRREAKNTDSHAYRESRELAKYALVTHWRDKVDIAQKEVDRLKNRLLQAKQV